MALLGFVALKFVVYYGVCLAAIPMLRLPTSDRTSFALKWAGLRLLLGLLLGLLIAWLFGVAIDVKLSTMLAYALSFVLIRYLAWMLVLVLIANAYKFRVSIVNQGWVLLGLAANIALDGLAIAGGIDQIKLFC